MYKYTHFFIYKSVNYRHFSTDWNSPDKSLPRVICAITFFSASFLSSGFLELRASWSYAISPRLPDSKNAMF